MIFFFTLMWMDLTWALAVTTVRSHFQKQSHFTLAYITLALLAQFSCRWSKQALLLRRLTVFHINCGGRSALTHHSIPSSSASSIFIWDKNNFLERRVYLQRMCSTKGGKTKYQYACGALCRASVLLPHSEGRESESSLCRSPSRAAVSAEISECYC